MKKTLFLLLVSIFTYMCLYINVRGYDLPVIKVACVGDSITEGAGVDDPLTDGYPAQLQNLLGDRFSVKNFGIRRYAALKSAVYPYVSTAQYKDALSYKADIVVIMFGTNDIKTENWTSGKSKFQTDYLALLNDFKVANPDTKLIVMLPPPIFLDANDQERPPKNLQNDAIPMIKEVASICDARIIDLNTAFTDKKELFPDSLHPNAYGNSIIADLVSKKIKDITSDSFADMKANLDRDEFAYLLTNILKIKCDNPSEAPFKDTFDSKYSNCIDYLYNLKIVGGVDESHFAPHSSITREEISVMLYRAIKVLGKIENTQIEEHNFKDNWEISSWAREAINYLYQNKIMLGTDELTISPKINISRENGKLLIERIAQLYNV